MAALWLAHQGISIKFVAWGNEEPPVWLSNFPSITYRLLPKRGLFSAFAVLIATIRDFFCTHPDFVYVQGAQQTPFLLWLPFLKGKSKLIYHTQDYLGPGLHWFYETTERFFVRRSDCVISNELNRARFMQSSYRLKQMPKVIRTALPKWWEMYERDEAQRCELLDRAGLTGVDRPRLIVAGGAYRDDRMSPQLLEAFAQLPSNYALVFTWMEAGSSCRLACKTHMQRLGLEHRIIFLEPLEFSDLLSLYACCDIGMLLYPNNSIGHFYQAPGRMTEYLRCGLSVVSSAFPGLELLTLKYHLGAVADPYNPKVIAEAILQVGSMPDENLAITRSRIRLLAASELAYETQAEPIFSEIFGQLLSKTDSAVSPD